MAISAEPLTFSPSETTPRLRGMPGASRLRPWRLRHHRAPTWTWLRRPPPPKQKTAGLWSRRRSARTALLCNVCNCADFSPWAAHGRISPTPRRARARRWTEPAPERDQQSPKSSRKSAPPGNHVHCVRRVFFNGPRDAGLTHGPGSITERGFAQVRSDVIAQEQQQVKHDFSGLVQEVRRSVVSCGANAPHPSLLAARQF